MATVPLTPAREPVVLPDEHVRHPLQRLRGTIRTYVALEGLLAVGLYVALWFWIGLLFDFGFFKAFGVDWIQVLPWELRALVLAVLGTGLVVVVAVRVAWRLARQFRDNALALLLERRFPNELGDRLITAVELADPRIAATYGFSRPMIDQTIRDAATAVARLPVSEVFDWQRLTRRARSLLFWTLGLYLLLGVAYCLGGSARAGDYVVSFNNVAGIWFERNVLLSNTIWPRQAHLELVNFPESGELRVGRDAPPPVLRVRAIKWVLADADAPEGWRALRWSDLSADLLGADVPLIRIPADWQHETVDQVELRRSKPESQAQLDAESLLGLQKLFDLLEERTADPRQARRLRQLKIPATVTVHYQGETLKSEQSLKKQADNEYAGVLSDLRESVRFRVNGEDYYTPYKRITLVPPPGLVELTRDEERPAYLYHRPPPGTKAQDVLRGKKQLLDALPVSLSGPTSRIDVPAGTNVVLRGRSDKELVLAADGKGAPGILLKPREGSAPLTPIVTERDAYTFDVRFNNVTAALEFDLQLLDTDGVNGSRHVVIKPYDDAPPEVDATPEVVRRTNQGYLVTAAARVPFAGKIRDDHGLDRVDYAYTVGSADPPGAVAAGPIASLLQHTPVSAGAVLTGPAYLAWVGRAVRALVDDANRPPTFLPVAAFAARLRDDPVVATAADLDAGLRQKPADRPLLKDHTLDPDNEFFPVDRLGLRVTGEGQVQPRYRMRLWVAATDNNVETGPGVGESKEKYTFLIVSENELIGEIAKEEENLHVKLEDTVTKLRDGRTKLDRVAFELTDKLKPDEFSPMARRTEEIQDALSKGWDVTQEVSKDYQRILKEVRVNQVNPKYIDRLQTGIVEPLDGVINQEFVRAEQALRDFHKTLEDKKLDPAALGEARKQLDQLIDRLQRVLDAMGEIININKLIEQLARIEKAERGAHKRFKELHDNLQEKVLNDAPGPTRNDDCRMTQVGLFR